MLFTCFAGFPTALAWGGAFPLRGEGSESSPYVISTAEELCLFASSVNSGAPTRGAFFELVSDIDLGGAEWEPIGAYPAIPFEGSFSGAGHAVSNFKVTDRDNAALFAYSTGAISGLTVREARISGGSCAAGIVAMGSADNCVSFARVSGADRVGGVTGEGSVFDCVSYAEVSGETCVGGVVGLGDAYRCVSFAAVDAAEQSGPVSGLGAVIGDGSGEGSYHHSLRDTKYSVSEFIRWALTHVDPVTVPTNASLLLDSASCGSEPWEYLYGTVRTSTSQTAINSLYNNYYTNYMFRIQYDEITSEWSRSTYATDCQGLLDAWLTYEAGETTDINAAMNYANWCTSKGEIANITRDYVIGEALFIYSNRLGKISHVGWICGFDEDGTPLVVEARGLAFGVSVTRFDDRSWTHRGLMTVKFNYDASLSSSYTAPAEEAEDKPGAETRPAVAEDIWDGTVASSFAGGTGSSTNPYTIANGSQLAYLAASVAAGSNYKGKYFKLTNDIWLNDTANWETWDYFHQPANAWTPIGCFTNNSTNAPFSGNFDGGGHTVYGIFFSENQKSCYGLFGYVANSLSGVIKNVKVDRSYMEAVDNVGGIVGCMQNYGSIINCENAGKVRGSYWTGGIAGYIGNSLGSTSVQSCTNSKFIRGSFVTGGIVGYAHENCVIDSCCNNATYVRGSEITGGIAGMAGLTSFEACANLAEVRGVNKNGGIVGTAISSDISRCVNLRGFTSRYRAGGLIGYMNGGTIVNCFNTGVIKGTERVGGLTGLATGALLRTSYNKGAVSGRRKTGAVTGGYSSLTVENVFALQGCASSAGQGTFLTQEQLSSAESYTDFDFDSIWAINPDCDYPYAVLRNVSAPDGYVPGGTTPTPTGDGDEG